MAIALDSKFPGPLRMMAAEQARSEAEGDVLPWTVAEFYRGQSVLLTGGSGFVGRVLLEKLLFYCPDIDTVYVLLRPRKGLSVQERLHKLLDVPLYPAAGDWRSILALVEAQGQNDPVALRALTTKILGPYCNTYTFTKNLAEHIVDHYSDRLPVGILRPSSAQAGMQRITQGRLIDIAYEAGAELPFSDTLYHPCGRMTSNYLLFLVQFFLFHLVPAVVGDALLSATGRKPMLIRLQRRIYSAMTKLSFFLLQNWDFANNRFLDMEKRLRPEDREGFSYHLENLIPEAFFKDALRGTRRFLMKELDINLPQAIRAYKSVRFDDPLITAVRTNVCATRDLLELATRMTKLKEKLYPAAGDWRSILALVEAQGQSDPVALRALTTKILGPYCNTYTFTKNLAEHVVDHYSDRLPVGILRPSVVVATACDPLPGWIDNFNGPMGLMVGIVKGVVHTSYTDPDCYIDYIPCDIVVKGIVLCSCEVARKGLGPPLVYHAAQGDVHRITQARALDYEYEAGAELPFSDTLYHPCGRMTSNYLRFLVQFFFFHLVPAVIGDALLSATRRKPMLIRLQRRIYVANNALSFFSLQNWNFANNRFLDMEKRLRPEDREGFCYQLENIIPEAFFREAMRGMRRYLMKEPDSNLPQAIRAYKRITYIFRIKY
ncbi:Fatty acyl-CoA reductase wat [Gryllus bimaculatus]|nr:Fatty acyl-CoA reductase wat [Gryllus bimaculatus]